MVDLKTQDSVEMEMSDYLWMSIGYVVHCFPAQRSRQTSAFAAARGVRPAG